MKNLIFAFALFFASSTFAQTATPPSEVAPATPASDLEPKESSGAITNKASTVPVADPTLHPAAPPVEVPVQEFPRSLWGVYGSVGVPHGVSGGLEYVHSSGFWSLGIDAGAFNLKLKDDANEKEEIGSGNFGFEGRYHPWQAAFFVGAGLGSQRITAKKTATYQGQSVTPEVKVNNTYLTPKVGWLWQFNSGLNFGVEIGAQVPLSSKVEIENGTTNALIINDATFIKNKQDVQDIAENVGKQVFPHLLVRFGYAF